MSKTPTTHNPANFEPSDYVVEDYLDNKPPVYFGQPVELFERERAEWRAEMARTFGPQWQRKIHSCAHCGNGSVRWITAVRHLPTEEVIVFGAVCTARLGFADKHAFKLAQLQARAEARKVKFTIWNKRQEFLAAHPEVAKALTTIDDPIHARNTFAKDVLGKLDQYGTLSDRQVETVLASLKRDVDYAARKAVEDAEPKGEAPRGRKEVTGEVLSIKWVENAFGSTQKMLVKLTNNAKVWVTVPGKEKIERGDIVTIRATWTPSRDDASFAFGSRPHLVNRIAKAASVAEAASLSGTAPAIMTNQTIRVAAEGPAGFDKEAW